MRDDSFVLVIVSPNGSYKARALFFHLISPSFAIVFVAIVPWFCTFSYDIALFENREWLNIHTRTCGIVPMFPELLLSIIRIEAWSVFTARTVQKKRGRDF